MSALLLEIHLTEPIQWVSFISVRMMKVHHHKILMAKQISLYDSHNKQESVDGLKTTGEV